MDKSQLDSIFTVSIRGNSMWPTFFDGQFVDAKTVSVGWIPKVGQIIVANHPMRSNLLLIKRISKVINGNEIFIEGDNPDPTSSEDSHNFGVLEIKNVLGIISN